MKPRTKSAPKVDAQAPRARLAWGSYRAADDLDGRATAFNGSGDYHADPYTRERLQRLSRSIDRNASLGNGPLTMALSYLLGDGTWPRPRWGAEVPDAEARTRAWMADAQTTRFDADGLLTLSELLETFGRCVLRDGDAAAVHDGRGACQLVEGDRIKSPTDTRANGSKVVQGVEFKGRIVFRYWIGNPDTLGRISAARVSPYAADSVTFCAHRNGRASQVRGVPLLSPSLDDLDHLDSLGESEIRSAETASMVAIGMKRTPDTKGAPISPGVIRSGSGMIFALPEGYEPVNLSAGRPNLNVPEFQRLNMRIAFMVLGLPLELLLLDLNQLNYAASRSLRNLAEDRLGALRRWLWGRLLARIVNEWQIARGLQPAPVSWDWPRLQLHDRIKEAEADKAELDNGTTSLLRLSGHDRLTILDEQAAEAEYRDALLIRRIAKAQAACDEVNKATPGAALHWSSVVIVPGSNPGATSAPAGSGPGGKLPPVAKPGAPAPSDAVASAETSTPAPAEV